MDLGYRISDLVEIPKLQSALDSLYTITGIPSALIELDGNVLTASGWADICVLFHRANPRALNRCLESDQSVVERLRQGEPYAAYTCANGLVDIGVPVVVEGKQIATIFLGQFFLTKPDLEYFARQAAEFGFDQDEYLKAVKQVPVLDEQSLMPSIQFLAQFGEMVAEMGLARMKELEAKRNLELSEERLRLALEGSNIGVWNWDRGTNRLYHYESWQKNFGITHDHEKGVSYEEWLEHVHPDDQAPLRVTFDSALAGKTEAFSTEYRVTGKDSNSKWILSRGKVTSWTTDAKPLSMLGIYTDITETKLKEKALRDSERLLSLIYDGTSDMMILMAIEQDDCFRCLSVNQAYIEATGLTKEQVIGKRLEEVFFKGDAAALRQKYRRAMKVKKPINYDWTITTAKRPIQVQTTLTPILDEKGNCTHLLGVSRDVTERKHLEKEISRLDRLNLVGEMAASLAHEIRNPLTSVRGFIQMLGDKGEFSQYLEFFEIMITELDRANSIITEYLSLAKDRPLNFAYHHLDMIVTSLIPLLQADVLLEEKEIILELEPVPELFLDEKEMRQLILNLVYNGLQAMPSGGTLRIKTFMEDDVVLSVQDEGTGIPAEVLEKLGTPFTTTKENGTGLGLAVCYSIVTRHKAAISVTTGPAGTTFSVKFRQPRPKTKEPELF